MALGFNPAGYALDRVLGNTGVGNLISLLGLDAGNAPILLMLGKIKFSLNTAAFTEMNRSNSATWAEIPQIGKLAALQYTGPGPDLINLPGTVYPDWRGSERTLQSLQEMLRTGGAYNLIGTGGVMLGAFVIVSISEERSAFKATGSARRVGFEIGLRRFAEADPNQAQKLKGLSRVFGDIKDTLGKAQSAVQDYADQGVSFIEGGIDDAIESVKDIF